MQVWADGRVYTFTEILTGDPNHDGAVDVVDVVIALQMAVRGEWLEAVDSNREGSVTSLDALMILQVAAGVN